MCHEVFIASSHDLPLVPFGDPPILSIELLADYQEGIRAKFPSGWTVRHACASSGCSCDFHGEDSSSSRFALSAYLSDLPAQAQVMIYDCWQSDIQDTIGERILASLEDLMRDDQLIAERRMITFKRN